MQDLVDHGSSDAPPEFFQALLSVRSWERGQVPLCQPQIALDILLHTSLCAARGQPAKMKEIHLAIGYSQDRIREIVKELIAGGWLALTRDESDGRAKLALPTTKCIALMGDYKSRLEGQLSLLHGSQAPGSGE